MKTHPPIPVYLPATPYRINTDLKRHEFLFKHKIKNVGPTFYTESIAVYELLKPAVVYGATVLLDYVLVDKAQYIKSVFYSVKIPKKISGDYISCVIQVEDDGPSSISYGDYASSRIYDPKILATVSYGLSIGVEFNVFDIKDGILVRAGLTNELTQDS